MRTIKAMATRALLVMGLALAVTAGTGCEDYGYGDTGGYDPYGYGSEFGGGYGPIDDDVFQNASDAWSDYIRG